MNPLDDHRTTFAAKLKAAGLRPVLDPGAIDAPCVLVGPPSLETVAVIRGDCVSVEAEYPIIVLAAPPGNGAAVTRLLLDVTKALVALAKDRPTEAVPDLYAVSSSELPAYEFAIKKTVRISEGA